ncbi:MAG TPA: hypothetical protein VFP68_17715 [Burkholderiaceae bacterium]|nr:hypothetical protein [Burkholderiaceae bacterium]
MSSSLSAEQATSEAPAGHYSRNPGWADAFDTASLKSALRSTDPLAIQVERYDATCKSEWNCFIAAAKNATFLFDRDYMDYHSDRFRDHSLVVRQGGRTVALLPANLAKPGEVVSHAGLTYGGLLVRQQATLSDVLVEFSAVLQHLESLGIRRLLYKRIPRFFSSGPDDEIDHALFALDARLVRRDCALVVSRDHPLPFRKGRRSEISKARRFGVELREERDFAPFWKEVLEPRLLARYAVRPVHTLQEISMLASRFPHQIRQFTAYLNHKPVAGATIYETPLVAHVQYSAVTDEGQAAGAIDGLFGWLIRERYVDKPYFDFGICNEDEGRTINFGLADWKEGFGARTCVHDFYEVSVARHRQLEEVLHGRG